MKIVDATCETCGVPLQRFRHSCNGVSIWIMGCPQCDDHCPQCDVVVDKSNHRCTLDEVIGWLMRIRGEVGGQVGVMLSFDHGSGSAVPYMPVSSVALDDDDPKDKIALLCVAEGEHPFGEVIKMHSPEWNWKEQ